MVNGARVVVLVLAAMSSLVTPVSSKAQDPPARPLVLLVTPALGDPPGGFEELRSSLRALLVNEADFDVVRAEVPRSDDAQMAEWGAAVARSEGADGLLWLRETESESDVVLWVVHLHGGDVAAASVVVHEPRAFDRGRALALSARHLLEPLFAPAPEPPAEPIDPSPATAAIDEAIPPAPSPPVTPEPSPASIALRVSLGPILRSDGPSPSARFAIELAFLEHAWVQVAGELVRQELLVESMSQRERAFVFLMGGGELTWQRLRGRLGGTVSTALVWGDVSNGPSVGVTIGALLALAFHFTSELFIELPLSVDGAIVNPGALPELEVAVGLLLGVAPALW